MTAKEIIAAVDELKPNEYTTAQKLTWLTYLDRAMFEDILLTHSNRVIVSHEQPEAAVDRQLWLDGTTLRRAVCHSTEVYAEGTCSTAADTQDKIFVFNLIGTVPTEEEFLQDGRVYAVTTTNANTVADPRLGEIKLHVRTGQYTYQDASFLWLRSIPIMGGTTWDANSHLLLRYEEYPSFYATHRMVAVPAETYAWEEVFPYLSADDELLFEGAAAEVYKLYLITQIDFYNSEYSRYNNDSAMFNEVYAQFERAYTRRVKPKKAVRWDY